MSALEWRKSPLSGDGDNCVEIADLPEGGRALRDSKDREGPMLTFTEGEWDAFVTGLRGGQLRP